MTRTAATTNREPHMQLDNISDSHLDHQTVAQRMSLEAQDAMRTFKMPVAPENPGHNVEMAAMLNGFSLFSGSDEATAHSSNSSNDSSSNSSSPSWMSKFGY